MTEPYYSDDAVTLYLGDCREVTEWLAADVLVTARAGLPAAVRGGRMSGWMSAEFHYWGCKVGLLGYCLPCDHYGWSWPHRRHAQCWRGSADGRAWQKRLQGLVSKRAEGDE